MNVVQRKALGIARSSGVVRKRGDGVNMGTILALVRSGYLRWHSAPTWGYVLTDLGVVTAAKHVEKIARGVRRI